MIVNCLFQNAKRCKERERGFVFFKKKARVKEREIERERDTDDCTILSLLPLHWREKRIKCANACEEDKVS